jgi:hypothetical protein
MTGLSNFFRDSLNLILSILVVFSLAGAWLYTEPYAGHDYYVAWVAADAVKNDTPHNLYDLNTRYKLAVLYRNKADAQQNAPRQKRVSKGHARLPMTATPFMYWVIGLLATGDYEKDLTRWQHLSLFLFTASVLLSCRLLGYSLATTLVFLTPVLTMMAPLYSDLRVSNVNSFQLGIIGLIFWLQSRSSESRNLFAAGLVISLLAMFKPNLAPIVLLIAGSWVVRGQFTKLKISLAGMVTGVLFAVLISSWWMGKATIWLDWLESIGNTVGQFGGKAGSYSIMTAVSGGLSPLGQLTLALIFCFLSLAVFWWGRRGRPQQINEGLNEDRETLENTLLIAMGCLITLLASALVWFHYYLLTIPMLIFAFRPWQSPAPMRALPILMLRILPMFALLCLLTTNVITVLTASFIDSEDFWPMASMTSVSLLFLIGMWQLAYGIRDQDDG